MPSPVLAAVKWRGVATPFHHQLSTGSIHRVAYKIFRVDLCAVEDNIFIVFLLAAVGLIALCKNRVVGPPGRCRIVWRTAIMMVFGCGAEGNAQNHPTHQHHVLTGI